MAPSSSSSATATSVQVGQCSHCARVCSIALTDFLLQHSGYDHQRTRTQLQSLVVSSVPSSRLILPLQFLSNLLLHPSPMPAPPLYRPAEEGRSNPLPSTKFTALPRPSMKCSSRPRSPFSPVFWRGSTVPYWHMARQVAGRLSL